MQLFINLIKMKDSINKSLYDQGLLSGNNMINDELPFCHTLELQTADRRRTNDGSILRTSKTFCTLVGRVAYILMILLCIYQFTNAQCDALGNECAPNIDPYICTEYNNVVISEGQVAEFVTTFYAGEKYKIVTCGRDGLGNVNFKLLNTDRTVLFDNTTKNNAPIWEFEFNSTNNYIIQAELSTNTQKGSTSSDRKGCIVILIGFDYH